MTQPNLNPAITDSAKQAKIEAALLAHFRSHLVKPWALVDFPGIQFTNPTPEAATTLLILQSIVSKNRDYTLINFSGGVAVVRTADYETINKDYQQVNENANMVIRGGTDKSADLLDNLPAPVNADTKGE